MRGLTDVGEPPDIVRMFDVLGLGLCPRLGVCSEVGKQSRQFRRQIGSRKPCLVENYSLPKISWLLEVGGNSILGFLVLNTYIWDDSPLANLTTGLGKFFFFITTTATNLSIRAFHPTHTIRKQINTLPFPYFHNPPQCQRRPATAP